MAGLEEGQHACAEVTGGFAVKPVMQNLRLHQHGDHSDVPLFSTGITLLLGVALLMPLAVRTVTNLEPYPAILLPSGSGMIALSGKVATFEHLAIYGRVEHGELVQLDPRYLLAPIPVHYLDALASNAFGQSLATTFPVVIRHLGTYYVPHVRADPLEQALARDWLIAKLRSAGSAANDLVIKFEISQFDLDSGTELSRTVRSESTISLH